MEGFNILDLIPMETDVFVNGLRQGDEIYAKRIEFSRRVNLDSIFRDDKKPTCLVIGDSVSFNYLPALLKETAKDVTVVHPNANCQGSENCKNLHRWLGVHDDPKYEWDVIAFNFGLADFSLDKETYQANLRNCLETLKKSKANLVWIESTPVPYGYNDSSLKVGEFISEKKRFDFEFEETDSQELKPGRMKLQNRWAAEVLKEFPDVQICETWSVVKEDLDGKYKDWWYGKSTSFKYPQSIPLARAIANAIRKAMQ